MNYIINKALREMTYRKKKKDFKFYLECARDFLYDYCIYWWLSGMRRFYFRAKHLISWLPVIWQDFDFDYVYLLRIMQFKFKKMREMHEEERLFVGVEKTIKQLKTCEVLLDRLIKEEYINKAHEKHNQKWNKKDADWLDNFNKVHLTEEQKKQEHKEFKLIVQYEDYMRKQDMEYLLNIIKKHYKSWWS